MICKRFPSRRAKLSLACLLLALATGCTHIPEWANWEEPEASEADTAADEFSHQQALSQLQQGNPERARRLLRERLATSPDDETAQALLRQIEADPEDYLGSDSFPYTVRSGESLSVLAQRFLGNHREFFILARYNGIEDPSRLRVGQTLRIPAGYRDGPAEAVARMDRSVTARQQLAAQDYQGVIELYAEAPSEELDREDRELLGQAHQGRIEAALTTADEEGLDQAERHLRAARNHPQNGGWRRWIEAMEKRIESEKAYRRGLAMRQEDPAAAAQAFRTASNSSQGHTEAKAALDDLRESAVPALHREAVIHYRNQELDEAIALWDQVLAIDPDFEPAQGYRTRAEELRRRLQALD